MNLARLTGQLNIDEGRKNKLYKDTATPPKWSIGVGRNLEDKGLREDEINLMLANDIKEAETDARSLVPNFDKLNDVRQEVLVNMSFNMGKSRLSGFKKFLAALAIQDFSRAADEMKDSAWYGQVKDRGVRLVYAMRFGSFK